MLRSILNSALRGGALSSRRGGYDRGGYGGGYGTTGGYGGGYGGGRAAGVSTAIGLASRFLRRR